MQNDQKNQWAASLDAGNRGAAGVNGQCHGDDNGVATNNGHFTPNPQVYLIYWDPYFPSTPDAVSSMNQFVFDLVTGTFMRRLAQYGIGRGAWIGSTIINMQQNRAPKSLTEAQLQAQLITWLNNGTLPIQPMVDEVNKVYLILAPSKTTLSLKGQTTGFCGYHSHGKFNTASGDDDLFWAVVQGYTQSTNGNTFVNSISFCVSHELVETFSNRDEQGVMASNACEICDLCEVNTVGNTVTVPYLGWQVERYWSQAEQTCFAPDSTLLGEWYGPFSLGGGSVSAIPRPLSAGPGPGRLEVFWRGTDTILWHVWYTPSSGWATPVNTFSSSPISQLRTGPLGSDPQPVSSAPWRIDVFWRGTDNQLWHVWYLNGWWNGPQSLGSGPLGSDPHPVSSAPTRLDVFWRGTDNALWRDWYRDDIGWHGPKSLGSGPLGSDPFPISPAPGQLDVYWRGTDNHLWHNWSPDGIQWTGPLPIGSGPLGSDPHPIATGPNRVYVFWRRPDDNNNLWYVWFPDPASTTLGWSDPISLGSGPLGSDPFPISPAPGQLDVFWLGTDNNLWHNRSPDGNTWTGPQSLGTGPLGSPPYPVSSVPGRIEVFWRGTDSNLWHDWSS